MKTHIPDGVDGVLCGNSSITAVVTTADCRHCLRRLDKLLDLLLDVAEGKAGRAEASALLVQFGLQRAPTPPAPTTPGGVET